MPNRLLPVYTVPSICIQIIVHNDRNVIGANPITPFNIIRIIDWRVVYTHSDR